jgi:large subunit ribosomal protein L15
LNDLEKIGLAEVDLLVLKQHGFAGEQINAVKVIKTGELKRAVILKGLTATAGAKAAIEAAGGKLVDQA